MTDRIKQIAEELLTIKNSRTQVTIRPSSSSLSSIVKIDEIL